METKKLTAIVAIQLSLIIENFKFKMIQGINIKTEQEFYR